MLSFAAAVVGIISMASVNTIESTATGNLNTMKHAVATFLLLVAFSVSAESEWELSGFIAPDLRIFSVNVFHEVRLIDDVNQVIAFRDSPEDLVQTDVQIPGVTFDRPVGFPDIGMRTFTICTVHAGKANHGESLIGALPT